jgi:hypothetical protein
MFNILQEQILLVPIHEHPRYSKELFSMAANLRYSHPGGYEKLREYKVLTLPCRKYFCKIEHNLSDLEVGLTDRHVEYMSQLCSYMPPKSLWVYLAADEIYVKSSINYVSGKMIGQAVNDPEKAAKTVQGFFAKSILGPELRDMVALFPVLKLDAPKLCEMTKLTTGGLTKAGFHVIIIGKDNHAMNRRAFRIFSGDENQPPKIFIPNWFEPEYVIFLVIDPVHNLKNVFYNWLNQKTEMMVMRFPVIKDAGPITSRYLEANGWFPIIKYNDFKLKFKFAN